jgi:hypothetical protein
MNPLLIGSDVNPSYHIGVVVNNHNLRGPRNGGGIPNQTKPSTQLRECDSGQKAYGLMGKSTGSKVKGVVLGAHGYGVAG